MENSKSTKYHYHDVAGIIQQIINLGNVEEERFWGLGNMIYVQDERRNEITPVRFVSICKKPPRSVWKNVTQNLTNSGAHEWSNSTLEQCTQPWWQDEAVCCYEYFWILFMYSIWEAWNKSIFKNMWVSLDLTIALLMDKSQEHKLSSTPVKRRTIIAPVINMDIPWAFFDGVSQAEPPLGGAGAVIQLST